MLFPKKQKTKNVKFVKKYTSSMLRLANWLPVAVIHPWCTYCH